MTLADIPGSAEAALEAFAEEPFAFALKPVVKQVLQSIASSKSSTAQVIPTCFPNHKLAAVNSDVPQCCHCFV